MEEERRHIIKDGAHRNGIKASDYVNTWDYFFKMIYILSDTFDQTQERPTGRITQ